MDATTTREREFHNKTIKWKRDESFRTKHRVGSRCKATSDALGRNNEKLMNREVLTKTKPVESEYEEFTNIVVVNF